MSEKGIGKKIYQVNKTEASDCLVWINTE